MLDWDRIYMSFYLPFLRVTLRIGITRDFDDLPRLFEVSSEFQIEALPESKNDWEETEMLKEGDEGCNEENYFSKNVAGNDYIDEQFMVDFARSIMLKLP